MIEEQLAEAKRQHLAELYYAHQAKVVEVSDADARAYFDAHAEEMRAEVHVQQILVRTQAEAQAARDRIVGGAPFVEVAKDRFPGIPDGQTPWDTGFLHWNQIPDQWRPVLATLAPGQPSEVIAGPKDRYWVIEVVETREDPSITFDNYKPTIVGVLRDERTSHLHEEADEELMNGATVVYEAPRAQPNAEDQ